MWLLEQLGWVLRAPAAPAKLRGRGWAFTLLYLFLAAVILAGIAALVISHEKQIRGLLVSYLLPEKWRFAGDLLARFLVTSQSKAVIANAIVSGAMILVSALLFPVKEKLSEAVERDGQLTDGAHLPLPWWRQGLEELLLVVVYAAGFAGIFWIGYAPEPGRKLLAEVLSYVFLFFTVAADFISPVLQRHGMTYSRIIAALLKRPFASLGFGACFALPAVLAGLHVSHHAELSFANAVVLLFGASVLSIVWAAIAGTWLGAQLLPRARDQRAFPWPLRLIAWAGLLGVLGWSGFVFGNLGVALHHKAMILRCEYHADFKSFGLDLPKLGLGTALSTILGGGVPVGAHLTLEIENPNEAAVALERNRLEVRHKETLVATSRLSPFTVKAGEKRRERLDFTVRLNPRALLKGRTLFSNEWRITLFLEIAEDFEFPIYLLAPSGK